MKRANTDLIRAHHLVLAWVIELTNHSVAAVATVGITDALAVLARSVRAAHFETLGSLRI